MLVKLINLYKKIYNVHFLTKKYIEHNKKFFLISKKNYTREIFLIEFNHWQSIHVMNSYLIDAQKSRKNLRFVAFESFRSLNKDKNYFFDNIKWYIGILLGLKNFGVYKSFGVRAVRVRTFNHEGPRRENVFGISSYAYQIAKIEKFKNARTQVFDTYEMLLSNVKGIRLPTKRDYVNPMWHLYPVRVKAEHRRRIFEGLRAKEIGVQVNYIPAHLHPVFGQNENELPNLRNSIKFYSEEISLPMMANNKILDKDSLAYISKNLSELVGDF